MVTRITNKMIAALGAYTLDNVSKVRSLLTVAGVTDIELHRLEVERLIELRLKERSARALADAIRDAGPLPECRCIPRTDGTGLVADVNGCILGHRTGEHPREVR